MSIEIVEVKTRSQLKTFINLPKQIYDLTGGKYVMPLNVHMGMMMGKLGSGRKHFFLALKDGKPVARIGAKVHKHGKKTNLHFGFFECLEGHADAARELVQKAHSMYPQHQMMGPFHFRMEDPYVGTLVQGFEFDPYFLMSYNPPYYAEYLEKAGLVKTMDLFTYTVTDPKSLTAIVKESARRARGMGVTVRAMNPKDLKNEARTVAGIFNDALSRNWGYEEFLEEQVKEMVSLFKLFIDSRVVAFAQKGGKDVGCLIMLPNYNPIIKDSKGKITPGLIWKYFKRKTLVDTTRGYALGVLKEYHGLGIGSVLVDHMFEAAPDAGYKTAEISWILANNGPMNELSKAMGGRHNKVYRVFEKPALQQ
ncbi:MAG: GNAT family N-acetyltransferase [Bdellovibrionia bacterium]